MKHSKNYTEHKELSSQWSQGSRRICIHPVTQFLVNTFVLITERKDCVAIENETIEDKFESQ